MLLKLAWRNLWRQKRRTLLTASALALALLLSLLMRCIQEGSYSNNIENIARLSTGLIQLQHPDFAESQSIDDLLPSDPKFVEFATSHPNLKYVLPRIESFALAAAGEKSKGVMVFGIEPEEEDRYSGLSDKLVAGQYLQEDDQQVLIAQGLADHLGLKVGMQVILYGQGYHGQTAAGLYRIKGIVHFPMPAINNRLIYLPIALAQQLYGCEGLLTAWVLHSKELAKLPETVEDLITFYGERVNVRDWQSLSPDIAQQILIDRASGLFLMYLLYGIVGFALFATLLMMVMERQREFAVMLATGLLRIKLLKLVAIESTLIAALGITLGLLLAFPILTYLFFNPIQLTGDTAKMLLELGYEPIIPVLLDPWLFVQQIEVVLGLMLLCLIYPMWRLYKMDLVHALRGGD